SLLVMVMGTGSLLIVNLVLKGELSDLNYGKYSLIITYTSLLSSFGLFGADQVFLRTAVYRGGVLYSPKRLLQTTAFLSILSSGALSVLFKWLYLPEISIFVLFLISFFSILIVGLYN